MGRYRSALVGKAGEAAVACELMRRGIDVAYPGHDAGVDLIAYSEYSLRKFVPIQVKTRSASCYQFNKDWFRIDGVVLVQVWNIVEIPEFYVFGSLAEVEDALGELHCSSDSWQLKGAYTATTPTSKQIDRMQKYRNNWNEIEVRLTATGQVIKSVDTEDRYSWTEGDIEVL
jgi:hypothetical protein